MLSSPHPCSPVPPVSNCAIRSRIFRVFLIRSESILVCVLGQIAIQMEGKFLIFSSRSVESKSKAQRSWLTIRATVLQTIRNKAGFNHYQTKVCRETRINAPNFYLYQVDGCAVKCRDKIAEDQRLAHQVVATSGKQDRREDKDIKKHLQDTHND